MNLIFLGPPGAGKGTQAIRVSKHLGIEQISTGDILRANIREKTPLGIQAQTFIDRGQLVPDSVVIDIVRDRLAREDCRHGYILDGFPRTIAQAEALEAFAAIDQVICIDIDTDLLVQRLSGRRVCPECGASYHVDRLKGDRCRCGAQLIQRPDDEPGTVLERIEVYRRQTQPLIEYYQQKGLLFTVDGAADIDEIFDEIIRHLQG